MHQFLTLNQLGPDIQVPVRYSSRAKYIGIRITHNGAELILPNKNLEAGHRFLLAKESWVRRKLKHSAKQSLLDDDTIPFFGKIYSIQHIDSDYRKVEISEDVVQIYGEGARHRHIFKGFLQERLLEETEELVRALSKKHDLYFSEVKLMNSRSRWGSCSSKAVISFNWRLIFAPKEILEYLVVHEMCHLVEMNHSPRFWAMVAKLYPNYKSAKSWLKANGNRLQQYLRL